LASLVAYRGGPAWALRTDYAGFCQCGMRLDRTVHRARPYHMLMAIPVETVYQRCSSMLLSYEVVWCSGAAREARGCKRSVARHRPEPSTGHVIPAREESSFLQLVSEMFMTYVFISYARPDEAFARELEQALSLAGFSTFLDQHPEYGIAAGTDWLDEIYRALARTGCLLYLSSHASAASPWCQAELLNAYWAGKVIIPIQLDDTELPLSQRIQALRITKSPGESIALVIDLLRRQFPFSSSSLGLSRITNPYPGLRPFDEGEAELFFGRWDLADEIARQLAAPRASSDEFMLAISGPSGCGKSSLVRAGVLPLLRVRYGGISCVGPLEPGAMPGVTVGETARRALVQYQRAGNDTSVRGDGPARVVMVLDQAERLFTGTGCDDPRALVQQLEQLAEEDIWFRCLVVFRSDVLATSAVDETFGRYTVRAIRVPVMRRDEMRRAISEPANMVGIRFEDGLIDHILDDTGGGQALPLLAYNLWNLVEMAASDRRITRQLYNQSGGVRATLRQQADSAFAQLVRDGVQSDQVFSALLRLVSINPNHLPSARPVSAETLGPVERDVFDAFVVRKLVVEDFISNEVVYQPAHEELLRWPALSDYIELHRIDLIVLDGLERKAELWSTGRQERLEGSDLARARYLEQRGLASNRLKALINASRVSERPTFPARACRPVVLFYCWMFLIFGFAYLDIIPFLIFDRAAMDSTSSAFEWVIFSLLIIEILLYVFVVRRKYRISRYGYYRIDGRQCGGWCYAARWLLFPAGVILTPVTRSFRESRLTWVDKRTRTELVVIKRDGSRRYGAQAPPPV
jgi:Novel STAND NTPase 1/TIR domain